MEHGIHPDLLARRVRVLVAGCGRHGIALATALPHLHRSLVAYGHPGGLDVTILDGGTVSYSDCTTESFREEHVGNPKSAVIADHVNAIWNLDWRGVLDDLFSMEQLDGIDIVLSGATTARQRATIAACLADSAVHYWLDLASRAEGAQYVLGEPHNQRNGPSRTRLHVVSELFPETVHHGFDETEYASGTNPRNLQRRNEAFVSAILANHALMLLGRLFHRGRVADHGAFIGPRGGVRLLRVVPRPALSQMEPDGAIELD
jgi:sulfur-carrier protein adenylyltransferase/sulfurtransferase